MISDASIEDLKKRYKETLGITLTTDQTRNRAELLISLFEIARQRERPGDVARHRATERGR